MKIGEWIGLVALGVSLAILWQIRSALMLVFAAIVLASAFNTIAQLFQRLGVKRGGSLLYAVLMVIGLLGLAVWLVVPPFMDQFQQMTMLFPKGVERFNANFDQFKASLPPFISSAIPEPEAIDQQLQPLLNQLLTSSVALASGTLGGVLNVLLVVILSIMFLVEPDQYRRAFIRFFPSFYRHRVETILDRCGNSLRGWLVGVLFNMVVIGGFSGIGLWILGVKLPLANGIFAGLLTFIPNIGAALSIVPPMMIALLDAPWKSGAVLVLYFLVQQLETNLLTPYVMSQQVSLMPAVTLMSQVFFATFFGFIGLLLALPLTVVGQVWLHEILIKDILDQWKRPGMRSGAPSELAIEPGYSLEQSTEVSTLELSKPNLSRSTLSKPVEEDGAVD